MSGKNAITLADQTKHTGNLTASSKSEAMPSPYSTAYSSTPIIQDSLAHQINALFCIKHCFSFFAGQRHSHKLAISYYPSWRIYRHVCEYIKRKHNLTYHTIMRLIQCTMECKAYHNTMKLYNKSLCPISGRDTHYPEPFLLNFTKELDGNSHMYQT